MKTMWIQKSKCTGCGACENICPKNAIEMHVDECGFLYPCVLQTCIDCNACQRVCENRLKDNLQRSSEPLTYAIWSKNEETRFESTSGGLFSELAKCVLKNGGNVVGAQYNSDNMVEHTLIKSEDQLYKIRQSKYIQSNINSIYLEIKEKLDKGTLIAFCGAPCQVAGLYSFLGKEYDNLITIDFICRGMNSPKAYQAWIGEIENKKGKKVSRVWFKYKDGGWKTSPLRTRLDFEDGSHIVYNQEKNLFMRGYLEPNLYIRPSCGSCDFKGTPRVSDITMADFWGIDKALDDDKGVSLALVNSKKGEELFGQVQNYCNAYKREFCEIFKGNVCFDSSVKINPESELFLRSVNSDNFSKLIKKYLKTDYTKIYKNKLKRIIKSILKKK